MLGQLFPAGGGMPIVLLKDKVIVGRSADCDITVPSRALSKKHCALLLRNGYWWVKDLDSRNGTGINGKRVSEKRILPNDILCVPKMRFRILYEAPADENQMSDESLAMSVLDQPALRPTSAAETAPAETGPVKAEAGSINPPVSRQNGGDAQDPVRIQAPTEKPEHRDTSQRPIPDRPIPDRPIPERPTPERPAPQSGAPPRKRFLGKLTPVNTRSPPTLTKARTLPANRVRTSRYSIDKAFTRRRDLRAGRRN